MLPRTLSRMVLTRFLSNIGKREFKSGFIQYKPLPSLPEKFYLKTWGQAAHQPRIVELCIKDSQESSDIDTTGSCSSGKDIGKEDDESKQPATTCSSTLQTKQDSGIEASSYIPLTTYDPTIDILYFPPRHFECGIEKFEKCVSDTAKNSIRKISIEFPIWYGGGANGNGPEGSIQDRIQISDFKNLKEFHMVARKPDRTGGGCAHNYSEERSGAVSFKEDGPKPRTFKGGMIARRPYKQHLSDEVMVEFGKIKKRDMEWCAPELKFVCLLRDGHII